MEHTALQRTNPHPPATQQLERNPAAVYLLSLGKRSRRVQASALVAVAEILGWGSDLGAVRWEDLTYLHMQSVRNELAERYAPATANRILAAVRGVLKECWKLGLMDAETYHRTIDVATIRGEALPRGRALPQGQIRALFGVCEQSPAPAGARDAALLAVLYAAGLRRSEAVALDLEDYDQESGMLTVRHGKGNKARTVYLQNGARAAMADWIDHRGLDAGALFFRIRAAGHIVPQRMTDQAALNILRRRATEAGVPSCSPHDLRRSMISDLLDAGADISTVQKLAGHANVTTTQRYDRRGEATKQAAAELLHVPYRRRVG
jgi:integrase/recombinase XerD